MNTIKVIVMSLQRRFLIYGLFILLASLVLVLPDFSGSVKYAAASRLVQAHSRPTLIQGDPSTDCPDAPALDAQAGPYLHFCSPKFAGDVSGPFGSHIMVFGGNFSSLPIAMYLTSNKDAAQACMPGPDCISLPLSPDSFTLTSQNQFVYKFNWTFVVSTSLPADFYLVAIYNQAGSSVWKDVVTPLAFTLLSSRPPCITFSDKKVTDNTSQPPMGCASSQHASIPAGSAVFIQGYNWLPGGQNQQGQNQQSVVVTATCLASSTCSRRSLTAFTAVPDSSGFFQQPVSLPPGAAGNYQVSASNEVHEVATLGGVTNTIASGALTFGGQSNNTALILIVSSGSSPGPSLWRVLFSGFIAFLALALAVLSFVISGSARRRKSTPPPSTDPQSSNVYFLTVGQLRDSLAAIAERETVSLENERYQRGLIEQARLRLEKGDFSLAINLIIEAQSSNRGMWQPLLEAIAKVCEVFPPNLLETAASTLKLAIKEQSRDNALRLYAGAFIAYRLLLNKADQDTVEAADVWYKLGIIYSNLPCANLETYRANLEAAIACFQVAHQTYASQGQFEACAATLHNLGNAYSNLPGDRQANLKAAIAYYQDALGFTDKEHPTLRAVTNQYLGNAYSMLSGTGHKRQKNLERAESYYKAARNSSAVFGEG